MYVLLLCIICGFCGCSEYFVAPEGSCDDTWVGTESKPVCSWNTAIGKLNPGDILYIRGGNYDEYVTFNNNDGTESDPITVQNYPGETPILRTSMYEPGVPYWCALAILTNWIVFDGIHIVRPYDEIAESASQYFTSLAVEGDNIVVRNLQIYLEVNPTELRDASAPEYPKWISGITIKGSNNIIEDCDINTITGHGIRIDSVSVSEVSKFNIVQRNKISNLIGSCFFLGTTYQVISGNIIENNTCEDVITDFGIASWAGPSIDDDNCAVGIIVRGNLFANIADGCIVIYSGFDWVVENNICQGAAGDVDGLGVDWGRQGFAHDVSPHGDRAIIRNNLIYDCFCALYPTENWIMYNNILVANNRDRDGPMSKYRAYGGSKDNSGWGMIARKEGIVFKNNYVSNHWHGDVLYSLCADSYDTFEFTCDYNAYWSVPNDAPYYMCVTGEIIDELRTLETIKEYLQTRDDVLGKEEHSIYAAAGFVNVPDYPIDHPRNFDFSPTSDSPMLDKGGPLAVVELESSGSTISVDNARYFYDGYGWDDRADEIVITPQLGGSKISARIVAVDYVLNTITLNKDVSASVGDWVNLPYSGSYPDIGNDVYSYFGDRLSTDNVDVGTIVAVVLSSTSVLGVIFVVVVICVIISVTVKWSKKDSNDVGKQLEQKKSQPKNPKDEI